MLQIIVLLFCSFKNTHAVYTFKHILSLPLCSESKYLFALISRTIHFMSLCISSFLHEFTAFYK